MEHPGVQSKSSDDSISECKRLRAVLDGTMMDLRKTMNVLEAAMSQEAVPEGASMCNNSSHFSSQIKSFRASSDYNAGYDAEEAASIVSQMLPIGWPGSLKIRGNIQNTIGCCTIRGDGMRPSNLNPLMERKDTMGEAELTLTADSRWVRMIAPFRDPSSTVSCVMELFGAGVLIHDLVFVPYALAWDLHMSGIVRGIAIFSNCFWTLDLCASLIRGFYRDGELVTDFRAVALNYVCHWFALDLTIVLCEWVNILLSFVTDATSGAEGFTFFRVAKMSKILRIFAALRIVRLGRMFGSIMHRSMSEKWRLVFRLTSVLFVVLWANHILSCAWYAIGRLADSPSWTDSGVHDTAGDTNGSFNDHSADYQYFTALHFSLAQTTLGCMEVVPTNTGERAFSVICLLMGLLFGSTLVSSLSATLVEVQIRGRTLQNNLQLLRRYLSERGVHSSLTARVHRQVVDRLGQQKPLLDQDVNVLGTLSPALRRELHYAVVGGQVTKLPFFYSLSTIGKYWFEGLCFECVSLGFALMNDDIFVAGGESTSAIFLSVGCITYTQEPSTSAVKKKTIENVGSESCLCEATVWCEWIHVGTAVADDNCEFVSIDPVAFWECLEGHHIIRSIAIQHCIEFHLRTINSKPPLSEYPTDLCVPMSSLVELIQLMPDDAASALSRCAVAHHYDHRRRRNILTDDANCEFERLNQEINDGVCAITFNPQLRTTRVTAAVELLVERDDGRCLVQLGYWRGQSAIPSLGFPKAIRKRNQSITCVVQELVESKFPKFDGNLDILDVSHKTLETGQDSGGIYNVVRCDVFTTRLRDDCCGEYLVNRRRKSEFHQQAFLMSFPLGQKKMTKTTSILDPDPSNSLYDLLKDSGVFFMPTHKENGLQQGTLYMWFHKVDLRLLEMQGTEKIVSLALRGLEIPSFDLSDGSAPQTLLC